MAFTFQTNLSPTEFDNFAQASPMANIMQESNWAKVKDDWNHLFCGVYEDGQLIATALLLCRSLPLGKQFGYVPRGPIMDYTNEKLVSFMLESLFDLGKTMRMISIKFDPNLFLSYSLPQKDEVKTMQMDDIVQMITNFNKSIVCVHQGYPTDMYEGTQPRHQLCFYQTNEILNAFPKKTRDKVKSALAYHIDIEEKDSTHIDEFHAMIAYTEKRKGIVLRSADYFRNMMDAYGERATMLFAYLNHEQLIRSLTDKLATYQTEYNQLEDTAHKKKETLRKRLIKIEKELDVAMQDQATDGDRVLISAVLLVRNDQTTELLYSGLNGHYRQYYAPYLLRYEAIQWAFNHGCQRFNFGGVQGTLDDGLFEFKSSFHPNIDVYIGEFDIIIQKHAYRIIEKIIPALKQWKLKMARKGKRNEG